MKFKHIIFLLPFVTFNSFAENMPSIKEYLASKNTSKYDLYVYGIENGLDWASEESYRKNNIKLYCKPNDLMLSIKQIKKLIDEELQHQEQFYAKYSDAPLVGLALKNAFISNFPCI